MAERKLRAKILLRINVVFFLIATGGVLFMLYAAYVQFTKGSEARERAANLLIVPEKVYPYRGDILADDGRVMATSVPSYDVYLDPCVAADTTFTANIDALSRRLAVFPGTKTAAAYKQEITENRRKKRRYMLLARNLNYLQLKEVRTYPILNKPRNLGGMIVQTDDTREHPFGSLAYRTIGFYNKDTLANFPGLEGAYNHYLSGKNGLTMVRRVSSKVSIPLTSTNNVEPENGGDVRSTISISIQDAAETALRKGLALHNADHGCVVIMEVATGAVKAISNLGLYNGEYRERYNYALGEAVDPGSTFKLMSYMRAMEDGYVEPTDTVDNGNGTVYFYGKRVWDDGRVATMGKLSIEDAFAQSSNPAVTQTIDKYYHNNPKQFVEGLYAFHLNDTLGLDIQGEAHPYIKHPSAKNDWSGLTLTQMAYGYELLIAPIHTLTFYNAVANGGKMVKPRFVQQLQKQDHVEKSFSPVVIDQKICSTATLEKARHMLESVVEYGTAKGIRSDAYRIAGKTGTAQISNEKYGYADKRHYASFVGYFPADDPVYSGIVTVYDPKQNGTGGGVVAAPIFKEIADKIYVQSIRLAPAAPEGTPDLPAIHPGRTKALHTVLSQLHIKHGHEGGGDWSKASATEEEGLRLTAADVTAQTVPDVTGMGLRDALFLLEDSGLNVSVEGSGYVRQQSLTKGQRFTSGQTIHLKCSIL